MPPSDEQQPATTPSPALSDERLAERAADGSREDFGQLISRWEKPLYNFLRRKCRNEHDAEDLLQSTFVEAWRSIGRFDASRRFSTWLYTIGSRQAIHLYRRQSKDGELLDQSRRIERTGPATPPAIAIGREDQTNLWRLAESCLSEEQRAALWLRYVDDFSVQEVAQILERPSSTTRVILFRARRELEKQLAPQEPDKADEPRMTHASL